MFIEAIRRAAQIRGDCEATICADRTRTWAQSVDRSARLSAALCRFSFEPGERAGMLADNSDYYLEAIHAVWWSGGVIVPMNTRWALSEHIYSLDDAGMRVLFVDDRFVDVARQLKTERPEIAGLVYMGEKGQAPSGFVGIEELIEENEPGPVAPRAREELAGIFYTGGTTGRSKGVMHSAQSLWAAASSVALDSRAPRAPRYLHAAPMFHLGDLIPAFSCTVLAGTHAFVPGFEAQAVARAVREHRIQYLLLLPTMISMLLEHETFNSQDFISVELLVFGGSPISEALLRHMSEALPQASLVQAFGQSESAAAGAMFPNAAAVVAEYPERIRSAGRALVGVELGIFDDKGAQCPTDEVGEIWLRTASAMMGYWNMPEQTEAAFSDGWLRTGDAGYLDTDGYLYVCDRVKDMIISGGENVFSAEVENAVASHPGVMQVAAIGVPDEKWGERVHAVIVPKDGAAPKLEDIQAHCRPLIAGYKIPRSMELRETGLPLSPLGKVLKAELREPHWRSKGRGVN